MTQLVSPALPSDLLQQLQACQPLFWCNPNYSAAPQPDPQIDAAIEAARDRLKRAQGLLCQIFNLTPGAIASDLIKLEHFDGQPRTNWFIKGDHALPVAGSIKARGGFHEVIAYAERLALSAGLIAPGDDLTTLASPQAKALFSQYTIAVGSTGNLGMSIGLCGAALGFKAVVHMSMDAKAWKKARLRAHGVEVIEYAGDYGLAVQEGRQLAAADPMAHFVDDERSIDLFAGYACAAQELKQQFDAQGITISAQTPLIVHLPCGVGGAPGGIAYGLRQSFDNHVYPMFIEPVQSPCVLVQMAADSAEEISVYDIGLNNKTELDGLAVASASMVVVPLMRPRLAAISTVTDQEALRLLATLWRESGLKIEPSAATSLAAPLHFGDQIAQVVPNASQAITLCWTTGGSLVPQAQFNEFLAKAP